MKTKSDIICEAAYARGKMLNNEGWRRELPRGIVPSDIDLAFTITDNISIFDDAGQLLVVEFNKETCRWQDLKVGQRTVYVNLVNVGLGLIIAACAKFKFTGGQIDTLNDIEAFQPLLFIGGKAEPGSIYPGREWLRFVKQFYSIDLSKTHLFYE